ncbi:MAG: SusC/RagA family TonB-linked outer membrane protein [Prolixibacteraceae bacterium]
MRLFDYFTYYYKYILLLLLITGEVMAQEKSGTKSRLVQVHLNVADEQGKPVSNASVIIGEGVIHALTDENGSYTFEASPDDFVTISGIGYEKSVLTVNQLNTNNLVTLTSAKLFSTSDDLVPLPFMTIKKRQLSGSYNLLSGNMLDKYPSSDIRNSLTGLANGVDVREMNGSPGLSAEEELAVFGATEKVRISARGRKPIYIIDEIPTDITEMPLDPSEIESVTIVKDIVGKSMYGPAGADGIIFIKTKRGRANERIINVNLESGVNSIDRMPEWVSGADYARINNTARINSGLDPLYSDEAIAAYAKNDPYDFYHPSVNYRDMIIKNKMAFHRANVSSTGGNDKVHYFAYLGYNGEGDIYKIGSTSDYNRLNARSNIDIKINDFLKVQFDFFGGLSYRRSSNYGYDPDFTSENADTNPVLTITEFPSLLNHITTTPPIAFPIYANNDPSLKSPWYAVSSTYGQNPIGNMEKNGYYTESGRLGVFNVALDYDMSGIVKGLKSRSYIGFNAFNLLRVGKAENYSAYTVTPYKTPAGADTIRLTKVHDGVDMANQAKLHDFYYQRFAVYENLSYERTFGESSLQTSLTYFLSKVSRNGIEEPQRQQSGILSAIYSYKDKYNIHGVLNYAGSSSFSKKERNVLSPSLGISWIISEENFMKALKFLHFFKIRAEGGVLAHESFLAPYYDRDDWNYNSSGSAFGPFSSNQWFGSTTDNQVYRTVQNRIGNPYISWEKRRELNLGADLLMFGRKLYLEVNYYNQLRDGVISQSRDLPYVAGISSWLPRFNSDKIRYTGLETAIQYSNNERNFKYSFGGNATIQHSKYEKYREPNYRFNYQYRTGEPVDAIRGLTYLGKFGSDAETLEVPQIFDEELHEGDLKYKDMNQDGFVDDNDNSTIGHSSPRLFYAINAKLSFKNVELTVVGTGKAFYNIMLTNQYYWNGWGDNTYSQHILDNIDGNYPKLNYYKVNNNFLSSNFWMTDGGYFKIQNVELAWNVPLANLHWTGVRKIRLFARGANLYTFSRIKEVDPESINSGVEDYPLFRTFTGGIKLTF